jgi:hypothetical protein
MPVAIRVTGLVSPEKIDLKADFMGMPFEFQCDKGQGITRPTMNDVIVEVTVEDPKVLTKAWKSAPRRWTLGNGDIYEVYGTNNREPDELERVRALELQGN